MFFKKNNNKDEQPDEKITDMLEYKYKKKKKKSYKKRIIVSGVIVFIALSLVIFRSSLTVYNAQNIINNVGALIRGENLREFNFSYESKSQYDFYREHLVVASTDGVRLYRPAQQGNTFIPLSYANMAVTTNDIYILAYDQNQSNYTLIEGNEIVKSEKLTGNILGARLTNGGNYSIITDESGYKGIVNVFNSSRELVYKWYSAKNWVINSHISPDCKKMAVIYLDTLQNTLGGGISFFEFDKKEAVAQYTFDGQMPLDVNYKDSRLITVLHTGGIANFNSSGKVLNEYKFNGLVPYLATLQPSGYACVLLGQDSKSDPGTLYIIDNDAKVKATYQPKNIVKKMHATNHHIILYMENQIVVLTFDGKEKRIIPIDSSVKDVVLTVSGGVYTIGTGKAEHIDY